MITEIRLPDLGENISSGTVVSIPVAQGDKVKKEDTLIEIEASKAVIEVPSPVDGIVKEILVKEGQELKVGEVFMKFTTGQIQPEQPLPPKAEKEKAAEEAKPQKSAEEIAASPSVRRIAREMGIDISKVKGSGPGGRIFEEDLRAYGPQIPKLQAQPSAAGERLPDFSKWGEIEKKPLSSTRLDIVRHVTSAWNLIPQVTHFDKADITALEKLAKDYSSQERKLTITPFIIKIAASALKHFSRFNAAIDVSAKEIIFKKYVHIGVAVDTPKGLLVPVIRDADKKSIFTLASELKEMAQRARDQKLKIEEMQGGCFTVTNLGGIGGSSFSPIINWPEAAILGVPRSRWEPVYMDNQFVARRMITFSLSYDHRIVDGADSARFLRWICDAVEQPFLLELEA